MRRMEWHSIRDGETQTHTYTETVRHTVDTEETQTRFTVRAVRI
jgi:hypothetical protein